MSLPEPTDIMLTTIMGHLSAAEAALDGMDLNDPAPACEAALLALRSASTEHERFVRSISHDLRNTLTLTSGQVQLLQRLLAKHTLDEARLRKSLEQIDHSVSDANTIIRRLTGS